MERSIVAVVDHGQARNSTASYSKSGGSRAKNSLLSLDLGIPSVREAVHCQHFVIRGYVAGMRKKDRNVCLPFASDGNSINVEDQLPPLEVPDFRWWGCQEAQSCQDTNGAASVPEETGVVSKSHNTGLISRSTGSPTRSNNDMEILLSDMQEAPKLDKSEGRIVVESAPANLSMEHDINLSLSTDKNGKCAEVAQMIEIGHKNVENGEAEIYTSASLHGDENHSSPYNDMRDKNIEIGHKEVNGHENGSDDNDIHETANADYDLARNNLCSIQERCLDDRVAVESNSTVLVDTFVPTPGNQDAADSLPVTDYLNCKANISTEACPRKEIDSVNEVPSNGLAGCNALKEASKTNKVITAVKDQLVRHPSVELEDGGSPSSESDGILAGDSHQDQQDDSSGGFPRRKTRKVRLLTDLLGGKENSGNNCCRTESSPSISIPDVPSSSASFSVPLGKAYQHENVGSVVRVPQRKRKIPYDQDRKPMDTNCSSNVGKKARASKGDADSVSKTIEISDSDSEGKVNAVAVYNCYNSHWSGRERSSLGKNKSKLAQVGGQKLTTLTRPELVNKINHAEVGDANKHSSAADTSLSKTKHESLPGRGIETSFRGCMPPPQQRERKPSLSKKKKKNSVLQVQDGQAFARPHINHMLGEGSMKRKDAETMGTGSAVEKPQSEPDACVNIGLDLSLNSYMPSQKDGKDYAKDGCGVIPFIPTRKGIFHEDLTRKDGFCAGEPSVSHNSTPGQSTEALLRSVSDKLARRPAMPRNYYPLPSSGNFSLLQNLDFSDPCNNEKNRVIHGRPEAVRLNSDQRAEKNVFAKGNSDDIPMDIVELLAKNQHERERSNSQARRDNFKRNGNAIAFAKANGNDAIAWLQRECPSTSRRKSPSSNAIINMLNANSKVAPTKRPTIFSDNERNLLNMRQMENRPKSFFEAFSPSQPKVSSGAPFSDSGTLRNRNLLSTEWKNKLTSHVSSPTNMQFFKPFNHSYNGLPQREAGHIWSPSTANHLLYGHNIPQKVPNESSNLGMHAQFAGPDKGKRIADLDLNVVDLNGASLEDQNKNLDLESLKRAPAEYQFLPKNSGMELNPKGMQSSKPISVDGTNFYEKLLSPCSSHPIININGKPDLIEKSLFPQSGLKSGPGESSRPLTSAHGRNNLLGKFCERPPATPINSFASLFQNVENVKRPPGFTNQMFVRAQEQEKAKGPYSAARSRGGKLAKSNVSPSDDLHRISDFNPGKDKQKGILSAVAPLVFPFPRLTNEDSSKCINLGPRFIQGTVRPTTDRPRTDVCTVNRNPADFSVPETGNEYMISGEDLKVGKKSFSRGKSVLESLNGRKKQRVSKTIPGSEQAQYRTT